MRHLTTILAIILLSGCSASWHVKRAMKLNPTLFKSKVEVVHDTLKVEVPKFLDRVKTDTLVEIIQVDPVTNTEYIVKYKIQNDTIMIDCPDNEVITVTETRTETITIKPTFWERVQWSIYIIIGLAVFLFIRKLI